MCDEYGFYVIAESDIESHGTNAVYVESPETSILLGVKTEINHEAIRQKAIDNYCYMARSPEFNQAILYRTYANVCLLYTSSVAASKIIDQQVEMLSEIDDEYLKERAGDIRDSGPHHARCC